jgi:hypothetical protein
MALTKLGAGAYRSGSIIQTQYTQFTGTNTYSVTADTELILTDLTVNITPNFTNSIIHLQAQVFCEFGSDTNTYNHVFYFLRDSTKLAHPAASNRNVGVSVATRTYGAADAGSTPEFARYDYFDSPSSTSQITYKVALLASNATETFYLNRNVSDTDVDEYERGISAIIAQEIAG